ncbi:MAG TPA: hypothetical protein VK705_10760 [Ferruginibacter sp.]|jgi:hypothetical protein|nr:hypothetical protein [Ferruginibacter sp.]
MKKLFLVVAVGVVLVSCKKSSGSGNTIQATFNGTGSTYNVLGFGTLSNSGKTLQITADNSTTALKAYNIDINLGSNLALVPGTYSDTSGRHVSGPGYVTLNRASISYTPIEDTTITSTPLAYTSANDSTGLFTVTITSISTTSVQGTFQGDVYLNQSPLPLNLTTKKEFTNGTFNVNLTIQ